MVNNDEDINEYNNFDRYSGIRLHDTSNGVNSYDLATLKSYVIITKVKNFITCNKSREGMNNEAREKIIENYARVFSNLEVCIADDMLEDKHTHIIITNGKCNYIFELKITQSFDLIHYDNSKNLELTKILDLALSDTTLGLRM